MIDSLIGLIAAILAVLGIVAAVGLQWFFARWDRAVDAWFVPKNAPEKPNGAEAMAGETSGPKPGELSNRGIRAGDLQVLRSIAADPWWGPESEQEAAAQRWLAQQRLITETSTGWRLTPAGDLTLSTSNTPS